MDLGRDQGDIYAVLQTIPSSRTKTKHAQPERRLSPTCELLPETHPGRQQQQ